MREQILDIAKKLYHNHLTIETGTDLLFGLNSVSNRFSDPNFIDNVCLSYRQDFGLLSEDEQNKVRFECKEWMRAIYIVIEENNLIKLR